MAKSVHVLKMSQKITKNSVDFQKLFDVLPELYIVLLPNDPIFTIVAENQAHADGALLNRSVVGKPLLEALPRVSADDEGSEAGDMVSSIRRVIKTLKPDTIELMRHEVRGPKKVPGTRYWRVSHHPLFEGSGADRHLAAIFQSTEDITGSKLAEHNLSYLAKASGVLSASLDFHETLQSISDLMVPEIADWCTVDIINDSGELELVALAHKDPAKVKWARALRAEQGPPDLDASQGIANVIRTGKTEYYPVISDEMLVASAKTKKELKLLRDLALSSAMVVPIRIEGNNIGAITMITTDQRRQYTPSDVEMAVELANRASLAIANARLYANTQHELRERARLEEELRIANEELEHRVDVRTNELEQTNVSLQRSNQELQNFAYVASHDLQEPLRKIQAFGNLLETEYADQLGDGKDYLIRMRNAAARMSILIEDILSFSRVTTKGREFVPVDLQTVIQEVIEDLEVRISETGATVIVEKMPKVHGDPVQMRQLFQNLIANALKFHREGVPPKIKIVAVPDASLSKNKACQIKVIDNGLGFDEKYLHRIFDVFQRLHNRESYEGTGIGLAVCRKIVERHGGDITATSQPGKGSTFIITLPRRHKKGENLL